MDELFIRVVQTATTPGPLYDITVEHTVSGVTTVLFTQSGSFEVVGMVTSYVNTAVEFLTKFKPGSYPPVRVQWEFLTLTPQ